MFPSALSATFPVASKKKCQLYCLNAEIDQGPTTYPPFASHVDNHNRMIYLGN